MSMLRNTCTGLFVMCALSAYGIEENNRNRWEEPVKEGPDKEVPGYLINLGPTNVKTKFDSTRT